MENQKNNELAGHSEMLKGFKEFQEQQNRNIDSLRSISEKMNGIHAATHLEAMKNVSLTFPLFSSREKCRNSAS